MATSAGAVAPSRLLHRLPGRLRGRAARRATRSERLRERASVEIDFVDQGYTGESACVAAADHGIHLEVAKQKRPSGGFIFLPRRWVVERSQAWVRRLRRLARDYERLAECLAGRHYLAFVCILAQRFVILVNE